MKKIRNVMTLLLAALALLFTGSQVFADTTGTITVQNAQVGQTYEIYKLFDATVGDNGAIAYTLPTGKSLDTTGQTYFDVDSAGNVTAKSTTTQSVVGSDEFKAWAIAFAGNNPTQGPVQATSNTVTFDNLAFGYYYIKSSLGATITVDSTTPQAYVVDKNAAGPSNATKDANVESAKIGETVNYTVKYNATNYVVKDGEGKQITDYTIVDTPTNLAINASSVVVKVKSTVTQTEQTITPQSVNVDSTTGKLTVVLPWINTSTGESLYDTPSEVTLTYSATVLPGAAGVTNRTGEATNSAKVTYNYDGGSGNITTETETVKTYGFTINKTNGTTTLTGAEFKVYDSETSTTPVKFVKLSDTMYRIAVSTDAASDCVEVIPAGMTHISGLKDGTRFFLEEIKAPAGYNKLTSRQEVVVNKDQTTASVLNQKGTELPSTGSFGTKMLYVVGATAILVAFVYMVAKRRVKNL
ncbi:SpaH/EbpB family LPXTG-anchored major pilin [Streptococcus sp.]